MIKVSVIVPIYNTEKHIKRCLDSLINQTLQNIEIICINDCSTDNSLNIIEEYAEKDNRIKIINLSKNVGAGTARNIGIEQAKGEYIGFVDSDDFVDIDFYEKLYSVGNEKNLDVAKGKLFLYDKNKDKIFLEDWININDKVKEHKANFYFTFTSAIFKREIIIKNNIRFLENQIHFEDPYFTIKAALFYDTIGVVDSAKYYYVENKNSSSRNPTIKHVQNQAEGSIQIMQLLNAKCNDVKHYSIVFSFVLNQLLFWANFMKADNTYNEIAAVGISNIIELCKHKEECLKYYFLNKKKEAYLNQIRILRGKIKQQ